MYIDTFDLKFLVTFTIKKQQYKVFSCFNFGLDLHPDTSCDSPIFNGGFSFHVKLNLICVNLKRVDTLC